MSTLLDEVRDHVEKRILARGLRYWRQGRVLSLKADGESSWQAQVEGAEVYRVEVDQGADGELTFSCSCPFDRDPICKHIVAVLPAIDELGGTSDIGKALFASAPRSEQIQQVLERLSKRELVRLVKELADNDRQFGHKLVARYSPGDKTKSEYLRLAREALSFGQDRHGFITYRGAERSFPGLMELLRRGRSQLRSGEADSAAAVAQAVLETTVEAYPNADDSIGLLSDSVDMALDLLGEAGAASGEGLREEVIDYCLALAPHEPYVDYGWGWKLTEIAAELAETADEQARLYLGTVYGGGDTTIGGLTRQLEAAPGPSTSFSDLEFDFEQPVAVSPAGDRLAIHRDGIEIYGPSQEEPLRTIDIHALEMRFAHDGNGLVVLGSNCRATVFRVDEGRQLRSFEWCSESPAGSGLRFGLEISRDGRYAAAADAQGNLRVWDLESGNEVRAFRVPARNSNSLSFSPDGSRVAWLGEDGLLQIWEIEG